MTNQTERLAQKAATEAKLGRVVAKLDELNHRIETEERPADEMDVLRAEAARLDRERGFLLDEIRRQEQVLASGL